MSLYSTLASVIPTSLIPDPRYLEWQPGMTPLSTNGSVALALAFYLAVIFGGQEYLKDRKAMQFRSIFMLHNLLLTVGSGLLLALMLEEVVPIVWNEGLFFAICNQGSWTPRLVQLYMINYSFKYWELLDTVFLVVKKKPLAFLHVFHHTATALLCYTQLNGRTSVSWVPIVLNLTVHVAMYLYYFLAASGRKIWWKKYLTTMQIVQFVIDLFAVYFAAYSYFAGEYVPWLPTMGTCAGTEGSAAFGCALLTSYLFLFIAFYKKTYSGEKKVRAGRKQA